MRWRTSPSRPPRAGTFPSSVGSACASKEEKRRVRSTENEGRRSKSRGYGGTRTGAEARSNQVDKEGSRGRVLPVRPPHLPGVPLGAADEAHGEGRRPAKHRDRR